eukprot:Pgem_evm1s18839
MSELANIDDFSIMDDVSCLEDVQENFNSCRSFIAACIKVQKRNEDEKRIQKEINTNMTKEMKMNYNFTQEVKEELQGAKEHTEAVGKAVNEYKQNLAIITGFMATLTPHQPSVVQPTVVQPSKARRHYTRRYLEMNELKMFKCLKCMEFKGCVRKDRGTCDACVAQMKKLVKGKMAYVVNECFIAAFKTPTRYGKLEFLKFCIEQGYEIGYTGHTQLVFPYRFCNEDFFNKFISCHATEMTFEQSKYHLETNCYKRKA